MRDLITLFFHFITTVLRVGRPSGARTVIAESVLTKYPLLILNRSRRRAPNLRILDRLIAGFCSLWIRPRRLRRVAIAFKPSTFLSFHRALVQRKYRLLFSPKQRTTPGPKGPTADLIHAVVEMKSTIRPGDVPKSPSRSIWLSEHRLIRMRFGGFSPSITGRRRRKAAPRG
jgi:putative transposase